MRHWLAYNATLVSLQIYTIAPGRRGAAAEPDTGEDLADAARGRRRQIGVEHVEKAQRTLLADRDLDLDVGAGQPGLGDRAGALAKPRLIDAGAELAAARGHPAGRRRLGGD